MKPDEVAKVVKHEKEQQMNYFIRYLWGLSGSIFLGDV